MSTMYKIAFWITMTLLVSACNQTSQSEKIVSATIEELLANPEEYENKEVAITGMITHVCRHGGQKCFILAEDGETQIRLVPGGDIDEFKIELEGSTVVVKGTFRVMAAQQAGELLADYESKANHAVEMSHSEAEKADVFIETNEYREITQ
ncbi:MAG: OB-fold nucleic acid binding domain-containing protein [Bacteroidales bacterium]